MTPSNTNVQRVFAWTGVVMLVVFLVGFWPVAGFRLHDLGWLMFLGVVSTGVLQAIITAWAILRDRRETPIFPRWIGYTCLWCALTFMPGGLIVFFKSGPLAWNGLIAWWLLLVGFAVWVAVLVIGLLRYAIPGQAAEAATQASGGARS